MDTGELNLHRAVMAQTVLDIVEFVAAAKTGSQHTRDQQIAFRAGCEWIDAEDDYPFSFRQCCRLLGLNRLRVRQQMITLTKAAASIGCGAISALKQQPTDG